MKLHHILHQLFGVFIAPHCIHSTRPGGPGGVSVSIPTSCHSAVAAERGGEYKKDRERHVMIGCNMSACFFVISHTMSFEFKECNATIHRLPRRTSVVPRTLSADHLKSRATLSPFLYLPGMRRTLPCSSYSNAQGLMRDG